MNHQIETLAKMGYDKTTAKKLLDNGAELFENISLDDIRAYIDDMHEQEAFLDISYEDIIANKVVGIELAKMSSDTYCMFIDHNSTVY